MTCAPACLSLSSRDARRSVLGLEKNFITSTIPSALGQMHSLVYVHAQGAHMIGSLRVRGAGPITASSQLPTTSLGCGLCGDVVHARRVCTWVTPHPPPSTHVLTQSGKRTGMDGSRVGSLVSLTVPCVHVGRWDVAWTWHWQVSEAWPKPAVRHHPVGTQSPVQPQVSLADPAAVTCTVGQRRLQHAVHCLLLLTPCIAFSSFTSTW